MRSFVYSHTNRSKAREFKEEMETVISLCRGIEKRADMFTDLVGRLRDIFAPMIKNVQDIVATSGTDYREYSDDQKKGLAGALATAGAIKAVLDTPLLTEDGQLTERSETLPYEIEHKLALGDLQ